MAQITVTGLQAIQLYRNATGALAIHAYGNAVETSGLRDLASDQVDEIRAEDPNLLYVEVEGREIDYKDVNNVIKDLLGADATDENATEMREQLEDGDWLFSDPRQHGIWLMIQPDWDQWEDMMKASMAA